jgi:CelD/BcsL family acetyltransferase involved in cellulose biosynthesis
MNGHIETLNPIDHDRWDQMLISNDGYTFFHTAAWAKVLSETYQYRPVYFALLDGDRLLGLVPMMEVRSVFGTRRGVSLPFTDYCDPVISDGLEIRDMVEVIKEYGRERRWGSIEIRGRCFPDTTAKSTSFYRHTLNLSSDPEQIFSGLKSNTRRNTRRNIRKAAREGVQVEISTSAQAVDEYYRLHCMTRKRHGVPPQPQSFFRRIHEHIIAKNLGFIALAKHEETTVAGSVFFRFKDTALYKFGASDMAYQNLRPADLVMWEAIKWFAQNGYRSFCFGRTALDNTGLRQFKSRWGAEEQVIDYFKYDLRQDTFTTEESLVKDSHQRIFRKMPIPLLKAVGSLAYKYIG